MRIVDRRKFWTRVPTLILLIGMLLKGLIGLFITEPTRNPSPESEALPKVLRVTSTVYAFSKKVVFAAYNSPSINREVKRQLRIFRQVKKVKAHLPNMITSDIYYVYWMSETGALVVKPEIMIGLFYKESTGRWNARNPKSTAYGYGQILRRTGYWAAPKCGVRWNHGSNSGPEQIRVINWLLGYFLRRADGNLVKALQLYRGNMKNNVYSSIIMAFASKIS